MKGSIFVLATLGMGVVVYMGIKILCVVKDVLGIVLGIRSVNTEERVKDAYREGAEDMLRAIREEEKEKKSK